MPRFAKLVTILLVLILLTRTYAQQNQVEPAPNGSLESGQPMSHMGDDSTEMREMARAMKSMADMCQMMMKREMELKPYLLIAGGVIGTAFVIALVLFVVLEIQCIRYFNLRIKAETGSLK